MLIYPAIDLYGGKAVRLVRGDYARMTVYSDDPSGVACSFAVQGAKRVHLVDLEGAKTGGTPNLETILSIKRASGLFCEVGGGIRSMETIKKYLGAGIDRVILGTAAVTDAELLRRAVGTYGSRIAVGVDLKDGRPAIRGWTQTADCDAASFCRSLEDVGVGTVIVTDIAKDGMMQGANVGLYGALASSLKMDIIASGGVSSLDDVKKLASLNIHGAIIGKAYYTGALGIADAIAAAGAQEEGKKA